MKTGRDEPSFEYSTFLDGLGPIFNESWSAEVDVTDSIKVYENGKVWTCPCGAGIGTKKSKLKARCYSCKDFVLVDEEALDRENQTPHSEREEEEEDRGVFDNLASKGLDNWT